MKNEKGFSLIEVLMVTVFIGIMSAVTIVSMTASRTKKQVETTSREVSVAIREAQNDALTGKKTNNTHLPCDYKFNYVNSTTYTVSYDYHTAGNASCASTQVLATYIIKDGVSLTNFGTGSIIFSVPFAGISGLGGSDPMPVVVSKGGFSYAVCVSSSGNIWEKANSAVCP
jgi:prepilin-type N-terminal cleavage/methylation domain-containing protein